jgi:hypothetical protein
MVDGMDDDVWCARPGCPRRDHSLNHSRMFGTSAGCVQPRTQFKLRWCLLCESRKSTSKNTYPHGFGLK